jgi:hypothetical protein
MKSLTPYGAGSSQRISNGLPMIRGKCRLKKKLTLKKRRF